MSGDIHMALASVTISAATQLSNRGTEPQMRCIASPPLIITQAVVINRLTRCVTIIAATITSGNTKTAVSSLDTTVSASVIGNERQKSMLLSLRSAYSESSV